MEVKEVIHKNSEPPKIILQRTDTRYHWEIHVQGRTSAEIIPVIGEANNILKVRTEEI
ncbi:MAG: hypothetical protein WB392_13615 [Methanotrichaceae archaeon]